MSERRDNTTESKTGSRRARARKTGDYYYDDSTGYELYNPEVEKQEEEEDPHQHHHWPPDQTAVGRRRRHDDKRS